MQNPAARQRQSEDRTRKPLVFKSTNKSVFVRSTFTYISGGRCLEAWLQRSAWKFGKKLAALIINYGALSSLMGKPFLAFGFGFKFILQSDIFDDNTDNCVWMINSWENWGVMRALNLVVFSPKVTWIGTSAVKARNQNGIVLMSVHIGGP